jgi:hypothetical protein
LSARREQRTASSLLHELHDNISTYFGKEGTTLTVKTPFTKQEIQLHRVFKTIILPFKYSDGREPRLPRSQSNGYDLKGDTERFFREHICPTLVGRDETSRFAVLTTVFKADDGLGSADLDNYATPLLNAITASGCVWKDDSQVDLLNVNREVSSLTVSYIELEVLRFDV